MSPASVPIIMTANPTYQCQVCDEHRLRHVLYEYRPQLGAPTNGRIVRTFCEHAGRGWRHSEILQSGGWALSGQIQEITGRDLAGLKARIDHEQGVIKQRALSA